MAVLSGEERRRAAAAAIKRAMGPASAQRGDGWEERAEGDGIDPPDGHGNSHERSLGVGQEARTPLAGGSNGVGVASGVASTADGLAAEAVAARDAHEIAMTANATARRLERVASPAAAAVAHHDVAMPVGAADRSRGKSESGPRRILGSLIAKLVLLLLVFTLVPVILYDVFQQADAEKQKLLLQSVREQGRLMAENLRPLLQRTEPSPLRALPEAVSPLGTAETGIKVLFKPTSETGVEGFYFVATDPPVPPATLQAERDQLIRLGVLDNLLQSCEGDMPVALRHRNPDGEIELLTSITPITTQLGCWAVVTVNSGAFLGTSIGQPYWQTWEVRTAILIYAAMALLTLAVFVVIWRNLMRFQRLAREIRTGRRDAGSFAAANRVSELNTVAEEFDRLTRSLQASAEDIRRAAEDNAHAFKTPIAIMRQSLEPLQRLVPEDSRRGQRALQVLETSIDRLDHLVNSARRLEETTAELLDPPNQEIDLSRLTRRMLSAYAEAYERRGLKFAARLQPGVVVRAGEDLLETVIENVVDNAVEVSPHGELIDVILEKRNGSATLVVRDRGPGVPDGQLDHIFERYVSLRGEQSHAGGGTAVNGTPVARAGASSGTGVGESVGPHLGIGLWIVRRNLEAVGGSVRARNLPDGGLEVIMQLPTTG